MKKSIFPVLLVLFATSRSFAQVDLQINPIGLLFSSVNVTAEFGLSQDFGLEGGIDYDFQKYGSGVERKRIIARWEKEVGSLPK